MKTTELGRWIFELVEPTNHLKVYERTIFGKGQCVFDNMSKRTVGK